MRLLAWTLGALLVSTGVGLAQKTLQGGLAFTDTPSSTPLSGGASTGGTVNCYYGETFEMPTAISGTVFGYNHNIRQAPLRNLGGDSIYRALDGYVEMLQGNPILHITRLYYVKSSGPSETPWSKSADSEQVNLMITRMTQVPCPKTATTKTKSVKHKKYPPNRTTTYVPPNTQCRYKAPGNDLGGPCLPRE